jgi:FkbM family methyltransferase
VNQRLLYELRGLAYWAECANPFTRTVIARGLPLGLHIRGYKRDAVGRGLYRRKVHEPGLTKFLVEEFSKPAPRNFLDLGANIGYFSCLLAKLAGPSGKVVSIEPEPLNRKLLEENLRRNNITNVTIHACAVGAADATAKLGIYKPANRGRHSMVDLANCKSFIEVPVRRLDDLLQDSGVQSWDLLKIDVEGYEPFVFEGAPQTLLRTEMLAMEFLPEAWKKSGVDAAAIFQKLQVQFSRVYRFEGLSLPQISWQECSQSERAVDLLLRR